MSTQKKRLVGVMPYGPGHKTVAGVTLTYVHTEVISGQHVDVVTYKTLTQDMVQEWAPVDTNKAAVANGFRVALNSSLPSVAEIVRVANLVEEGI